MLKSEEPAALDGGWYEEQLGQDERRRRGHYSTPPELVARMLEWVGYSAGGDLEHLALLDPSCGVGNFLAGAGQMLLAHGQAHNWSASRTLAALQANLWGLEMDPAACALAELRLRALARNLAPTQHLRFHLHQADALALAATPRFQMVIGNPPYLAARHHDLQPYQRDYLSNGQRDAYLLFVEQACRFVAPDGWLGLVLPDPMLARGNAADARRLLLESFTVKHLVHLEGVFRAEVGTLVLIARHVPPPPQYTIPWSRLDWKQARQGRSGLTGALKVEVWRRQPRAEWRYLLGAKEATLFERLECEVPSAPLGDLVSISRGEEVARSAATETVAPDATLLPVLRGGLDVRPFRCRFAGVYLRREQVIKPLERYRAPKLLVVKSTGLLSAALDEQGYAAIQTLYLLHPKTAECLPGYLLALLNSRLLRGYLWLHHTAYKLVQPQIEQEVLARLPIPLAAPAQQQELAALSVQLRQHYQQWDARTVLSSAEGNIADACENEAAWIQLERTVVDLNMCLNSRIGNFCGLSADEQALLERLPAPR
ncbi:MAG TPA: N-6 DNA methylase [Ktedonobacterales bacterium]|nr:N-6 DNA methylase [Ktedonobacterales bacterium]